MLTQLIFGFQAVCNKIRSRFLLLHRLRTDHKTHKYRIRNKPKTILRKDKITNKEVNTN